MALACEYSILLDDLFRFESMMRHESLVFYSNPHQNSSTFVPLALLKLFSVFLNQRLTALEKTRLPWSHFLQTKSKHIMMIRFCLQLICFLLACSACLFGCKKETFDDTVTEIETPSPESIASVDCPTLMLNAGEACDLDGVEGMVSPDCECVTMDSVDLIALEFINNFAAEVVVTVETDPPFLAGPTYVVVPASGITVSYYLPDGTNEFTSSAYFACPNSGVTYDIEVHSNPPSVDGAIFQVHVDCL